LQVRTDSCSAIKFAMKRGVGRMKHLQLKCTSLQDDLRNELVTMKYVRAEDNTADFLTKGLKVATFVKHREKAGVKEYTDVEPPEVRTVTTPLPTTKLLTAGILALQVGSVQAMEFDAEFLLYCWLLFFGVLFQFLFVMWLLTKLIWLSCGQRGNCMTRAWDRFVRKFLMEESLALKLEHVYTTRTGERAHLSMCHHVVDARDHTRLRSGVHVWEICSQCRKHKYS
jgi:hypothetical protein